MTDDDKKFWECAFLAFVPFEKWRLYGYGWESETASEMRDCARRTAERADRALAERNARFKNTTKGTPPQE